MSVHGLIQPPPNQEMQKTRNDSLILNNCEVKNAGQEGRGGLMHQQRTSLGERKSMNQLTASPRSLNPAPLTLHTHHVYQFTPILFSIPFVILSKI